MRPATKRALDTIVDCISCADGGVGFVRLRQIIEKMDMEAANDPSSKADDVVAVVVRFARLVDLAYTRWDKQP